ncbi:MAG: ROK family transcriptional regulator [Bacteroidetes bacterium]|nr:ROK family transcriptional regulator [Bacteroidota bacterium]
MKPFESTLLPSNKENIKNQTLKKHLHKKKIINILYKEGQKSNKQISKYINLSPPTITRLLNDLIREGLVLNLGIGDSFGGRKPNIYGINPDSRYILGIDIGRNIRRFALLNFHNEFVTKLVCIPGNLENNPETVNQIYQQSLKIIKEAGIDYNKIIGVGIGLPGLINTRTGRSYGHLNYNGKSVSQLFEEKFNLPVFTENNSNLMALGEHTFGLAKGKENVLCLTLSSGVGMGLILNGKLYSGKSGFAGEFGHINIEEKNGLLCKCGKKGCLETMTSEKALVRMAKEGLENGCISMITDIINNKFENITPEVILKAAEKEDHFAIDILSKVGHYLGKGIAILIHLYNPEMIIIGGEMAKAGQYLTDSIKQTLNKRTISLIRQDTKIVTSELGKKTGVLGATSLVMHRILQ